MSIVYLDIETIPGEKKPTIDDISCPCNIKKPDSIKKWFDENAASEIEKLWRKQSLAAEQGRIICIGIGIDNEKPFTVDSVAEFYKATPKTIDLFVGHNIRAFDAPWIFKHSIRHGVKPHANQQFAFNKFRGNIADTMEMWACEVYGSRTKLDTIAKFLGVGQKTEGIDGSKVFDYWLDGRIEEIESYCCDDVALTREVYKRLKWSM